jgi:phage gp29-like protein
MPPTKGPTFTDWLFSTATGYVEQVSRAMGSPFAPKDVRIPGIPSANAPTRRGAESDLFRLLRTFGAYAGRVSSDAGPSYDRYSSYPANDLTPDKIIGAQREARASGIPLRWVEMIDQVLSRDGHYMGVTTQRVQDVTKGSFRLTRASNDDASTALRNFTEEAYRRPGVRFTDGLGWLLMANAYCYSALEVEWVEESITFAGPRGERIGPVPVVLPKRLWPVHPKHFRFDIRSDEPLLWMGAEGASLPFGKFIFFGGEGHHPITVQRGHAWQCVWYSMFRSMSWASWAVHVDRFSLPIPLIEYQGDIAQYDQMKAAYEDILNTLGTGKGAIYPSDGSKFDLKDPPQGGRGNDPAPSLSDACNTGQSIRVIGATLTTTIGNSGSFAASTTHAETKYAKEEDDARRLWETIDEQLTTPLIAFNAAPLAKALNAAGYNVTPDLLNRRVPRGKHRVPRESDPEAMVRIASGIVNDLGLQLSTEAFFDQIDFAAARDKSDVIPGKAQQVSKGGALVGAVKASNDGAEAPEEPDPSDGGGGPGSTLPKESPQAAEPARMAAGLEGAIRMDGVDVSNRPRDAHGRFAHVGTARTAVAQHVANHLREQGHEVEAKGSTVHIKGGGSIEIGNKGDRTYQGTRAKVQHSVEAHLVAHPEKHTRDWVGKTTPPPPVRKIDPVKAAAREKVRAEKQAARAVEREEKVKARSEKRAKRLEAEATRKRQANEKKKATAEAKAASAAAIKAQGVPLTPDGKVDASRVPGATARFKPLTSTDPANSYKGRSYKCKSGEAMLHEWLSAPARPPEDYIVGPGESLEGWTNERVANTATGRASGKDTSQWDPIREKYGVPKVATFADAFKVLAAASARAARQHVDRGGEQAKEDKSRLPDWRHFDWEALKECRGFENVGMPPWLHEAEAAKAQQAEMEEHYRNSGPQEVPEHQVDDEPYGHRREPEGEKSPADEEDVDDKPFGDDDDGSDVPF